MSVAMTGSVESKDACTKPPWGWRCTRIEGHEGPCAAVRCDPRVSATPTYIECQSYTEFKPQFGLFKEQIEAVNEWMKQHDAERHIEPGQTHRYSGAIGGAYTYEFTSTSMGMCVHVRCTCGEEIDVSDYSNW